MKSLNQKIRMEMAENAKLREINKDAPTSVAFKNLEKIKERDKKIEFFKKLSSELKKKGE